MLPKKAKDLILPTAETTGSSEDLVEAITSFYWSEIRKNLVELKAPNITLHGLGSFKIKHWKIDEIAGEKSRFLNVQKSKKGHVSFQNFAIMKETEAKLKGIRNIQKLLAEDEVKKQKVKERRYGTKEHLDKPKKNTRRNNKLNI